MREFPLPVRRVSGNLSDPERVLHALGIPCVSQHPSASSALLEQ